VLLAGRIPGIYLTCFLLFAPASLAQNQAASEWDYKLELTGNIGHGWFHHGDSLWGSGLDFGGGIGVRPFRGALRGLGFEVELASLHQDQPLSDVASRSLKSFLLSGNAVYHFNGRGRVQPFVVGGLGMVRAEYRFTCSECVFNEDPITGQLIPIPYLEQIHATKLGITLGTGIKLAVTRHISLRPQILLVNTTPGSGYNWTWTRFQFGTGFHW
jgi:opacity protein-like surface antigen